MCLASIGLSGHILPLVMVLDRPGFVLLCASVIAYMRYAEVDLHAFTNSAPSSVSWWLKAWPLRCSPHTAISAREGPLVQQCTAIVIYMSLRLLEGTGMEREHAEIT